MRFYLKDMCDAVIGSLDFPSEDFQDNVREVFCKMDQAYKLTGLNDIKRAEKLSLECRHILVVLRLFPIELVLAMNNLYKKTLWGFISIYLDFKMILIEKQSNKEAYFDDVMKDIFRLLGPEDKTSIWSVVVTSHTLNRLEILKLLASRCVEATKESSYDHEQYIRMIWVLHVFFSQCKKSQAPPEVPAKVLETALKLKQPKGLCKWMCHHFPGFGWKGLTDANVHEALVSEKQPKTFFKQVYQTISKDDTLKYLYQTENAPNGIREEDSSSQSSESVTNALKRAHSPVKGPESSPKKLRLAGEVESEPVHSPEERPSESSSGKSNNRDKEDKESSQKSSKDGKMDDSSSKSESSSKATKTLGPGRSKPISRSAFLDDDEDTVDMDTKDGTDDEIKQANKENKSSDASKDDVTSVKKGKSGPKKNKIIESSDENDATAESDFTDSNTKSKRTKLNQNKKEPKIPSDSETDVDDTVETTIKEKKETKRTKSVKRKVNDDSDDSDNTIAESDNTDIVETGRRGRAKSTNSRSQSRKPQQKRLKADSSVDVRTDDGDKPLASTKLSYADDAEIQRIIDEYHNGPYAYIFDEFEASKMNKGAEPFINLSPIPPISWAMDIERETTLADVLHNNKQKAKEQKQPQRKRKGRR